METETERLQRHLERYRWLLQNTDNGQAVDVLRNLIAEAEGALAAIERRKHTER